MRQVPQYLVIGSGRMALHFCRYLTLLNLPFISWCRRTSAEADLLICNAQCSHVLLLISDDSIEPFLLAHPYLKEKIVVHFSGRLYLKDVHGAHPLMTFGCDLYDLETYKSIPFVLEESSPAFAEILPNVDNNFYRIPVALKNYYHTLCVMSGNFTVILWQKFFKELTERLHLPPEMALPYLIQTVKNLMQNPAESLTGPLARNDTKTIAAHLDALNEDEYKAVYQAFLQVFVTHQGEKI